MKFIHAADIHLDTPFANIKNFSKQLQNNLRNSTYTAATKVFDTAIREHVDFVILAGDTYDNTEHSLTAQQFLNNQFTRLKENNIGVYLVYGNHDYYRNDFASIKFPENVHIFTDQVSTLEVESHDGLKVGITGFSYYQQHVNQDMVTEYPSRGKYDYQIGILHAGVGDNNYSPFTVNELLTKGYDYWALGHIHKREVLHENPFVVYPGDTQGRNQNETGTKGFYLVTVLSKITNIDFVPSSSYVWKKDAIAAEASDNLSEMIKKIDSKLDTDDFGLLTLDINNAQLLNEDLVKSIERGDLLHHFEDNVSNTILYRVYLKFGNSQQLQQIDQRFWDDSVEKVFDLNSIKDLDKKLYNIDVLREHMDSPDFLKNIQELTKSTINKKFIGEEK
ncbi:metallophosphoesterase family protein [Companilactobacillus mishanensis]|uniref:DNA repair exonuclease n=1 Tax=Companilactobacillus mishanensis TaxID=2486008 RepID=A0A5P0ZJQ3_9LACO|nr:DNA repair exonuclease [Companilactobacillus mishanensis]MQS53304.1 DNA repair exonuclease [Companilactobacillus mishanensis]